jgi:ATP-dependent helicase/nuclease subunit A
MSRQWTDNQVRAISALERDVCVSAGAGSGKTGVLVERFVRIVRESLAGRLPPQQRAGVGEILVITFTEKATREMKERIVRALEAAGLREERRALETAYISTIHGFCSRLLKENPFEAGVDPDFRVLDETEARYLLRGAFERVIETAYLEGEAEIIELVSAVQDERVFGGDIGDPLNALYQSVNSALDRLRGAGYRREEIEAFWRSGQDVTTACSLSAARALLDPVLAEVNACLDALQTLRAGIAGAMEMARVNLLQRAAELAPLPESAGIERLQATLSALEETAKAAARAARRRSASSQTEIEMAAVFERLKMCGERARTLFAVQTQREEQAALHAHRFWRLLSLTWAAYAQAKRSQSALDNDDLQSEAVYLLETEPGVLGRFQRRFRYLMVDEFQDTNPLQMRLIRLLHEGIADRPEPNNPLPRAAARNHLFIVGDVQQSIYAFRNADATIFRQIERDFRLNGAGDYISLADNFRSRPEILQFVNSLFRQIWSRAETPFTPLQAGASHAEKPCPSIEFLLTRDMSRSAYTPTEADAIAGRILQIVQGHALTITDRGSAEFGRPIRFGDIAVLLRGLTEIEKYENAFVRRGVPYFVVGGGRGYYARNEVRDVMNVLTSLDTPLDDLALVATLRSPMFGVNMETLYALACFARAGDRRAPLYPAIPAFVESEPLPPEEARLLRRFYETMETLRAQEDRLPVGHLLERILTATHYDVRLLARPNGRRRLANVRKLLQMANAVSVHGVADFIRRLREIEKLSEREGDAPTEEEAADVVRVLSIHKAKGLEFPVVFLGDMARSLIKGESGLFLCDPKRRAIGCKMGDYQTAAYRAIAEERQQRDIEESARLLYVALTRAREHLILCGSISHRRRPLNWADSVFPLAGVSMVEEPETRLAAGGTPIRLIPMSVLQTANVELPAGEGL